MLDRLIGAGEERRRIWGQGGKARRWPEHVGRAARVGLGAAGAGVGLLMAWGFYEAHAKLAVRRERARIPGLPDEWDGRRVAILSDLHIGAWLDNEGVTRRAVSALVEAKPAAVLLLGDLITPATGDPPAEVRRLTELIRPLPEAGLLTLAVLGDHDYGIYSRNDTRNPGVAEQVRRGLEEIGVPVLMNEAVALRAPRGQAGSAHVVHRGKDQGQPADGARDGVLWIAGLGSAWAGDAHPDDALEDIPDGAPRIVAMHNPTSFPRLAAGAAPLAVAGHTHCGQVRIPGLPHWSWLDLIRPHIAEDYWSQPSFGARGNHLYVTCGIGLGMLPIRVNDPPEVVLFTLTAHGDDSETE